jgi:hypothetical protein
MYFGAEFLETNFRHMEAVRHHMEETLNFKVDFAEEGHELLCTLVHSYARLVLS